MGEAAQFGLYGGIASRAPGRALLEVVRLAFEGGIAFASETASPAEGDADADAPAAKHAVAHGKELPQPAALPAQPPVRPPSTGSSSRLVPGGPCMWCGVTATPQWRRPRGTNKLLCNACGIFFTRYGRLPERSQGTYSVSLQAAAAAPSPAPTPAPALAAAPVPVAAPPAAAKDRASPCSAGPDLPPSPLSLPGGPPGPALASAASLTGTSPLKRKDAPQPESELRCDAEEEEEEALVPDAEAPSVMQPPPPPPPLLPVLSGGLPLPSLAPAGAGPAAAASAAAPALQPLQPLPGGLVQGAAGLTDGTAAPTSTLLTVAPLDLGSAGMGMGLLGGLPLALNRFGAVGSAAGSQPPASAPGPVSTLAAALGASSACGPGSLAIALAQPPHQPPPGVSMLPPDLLSRPFTLPPGLLPSVSLLDAAAPPPRPLYARPPKRRERRPWGDSDDSGLSTDSHAAHSHNDPGNSHDEDDGGTTTTTTTSNSAFVALGGMSGSPPGLSLSPALFRPLLPGLPAPPAPALLTAGPGAGGMPPQAGGGGFAPGSGAPQLPPLGAHLSVPSQHPEPQQVILLPTRRSKGPRSRINSATPSSSTQA
ncbi:hypothetical protein HYH03_004205 [Edaphochlamys debaryana]|uniref:GATA-type domain-containing protein n=1 Tax=Edaphochlamys debaryana TaxID=47281 RepID=A0A835Y8B6_9CHLO|nr:hypothetical protein HYH03_004205 [Edaphochlamys debaryana]|eukprot:KAG2497943.1 hypothetical protein HYH03_004205 [Edaphochlamys debaryana]